MSSIRPIKPEEYPTLVDIMAAAFPASMGRPSAEFLRHYTETMPPKYRWRRDVLDVDGQIVGASHSRIPHDTYHPQKFFMSIVVHPDHQRKGYGHALFQNILKTIEPDHPIRLRSSCREESSESIEFLTRRGFVEDFRMWESTLELDRVDLSAHKNAQERMAALGITILPLSELKSDSEWRDKIYNLSITVEADMPMPEPYTAPKQSHFEEVVYNSPRHMPEAWFVAVHGERWVGISSLEKHPEEPSVLLTDNTGVIRAYRRKHIATAIKLHGLAWAKQRGYKTVRTNNHSMNQPMLAINEKLGFKKMPADIDFRLDLKS